MQRVRFSIFSYLLRGWSQTYSSSFSAASVDAEANWDAFYYPAHLLLNRQLRDDITTLTLFGDELDFVAGLDSA